VSSPFLGGTVAAATDFGFTSIGIQRQRRTFHLEPGAVPQDLWNRTPPALKARFTSGASLMHTAVMPQSLSRVILHIIFSTRNREPWLDLDVRPRMHAYLATVCRDSAPISCTSAVLVITSTLSQRCHEPFRKLK